MDLAQIAQTYVSRMVNHDEKGSPVDKKGQIKVLLLDKDTTSIISLCTTQSVLLKHEIYLIDQIDNPQREKMRHLKCLVFIRPTSSSIEMLIEELRNPKYASYELYFSNVVKKSQLERLAESDDYEIVTKVQEMFADYLVINRDLWSLNLTAPVRSIFADSGRDTWTSDTLIRSTDAMVAMLLSLKQKPLIRYDRNSNMAKKLASEMSYLMNSSPETKSLFDFRRPDTPPICLIIDRRNDPVTPLLTPWTYQAMVHELIGIQNNRVDLSNVPEVSKDLREIVLSSTQDQFFAKSMYLNFGDLGATIKDYVSQYQAKTKTNSALESIADMKRFVEDYPEFRKLSGNVSKHVTLVSELSRLVSLHQLLEVSELEQSLACNDNHNSDLRQIQQFIMDPQVSEESKIRLIALYGLRYQHHSANSTHSLLGMVQSQYGGSHSIADNVAAVRTLLESYAGSDQRQENLFGSDSFFAKAQSGFKGLKGVENVYTQHTPLLRETLSSLIKGKLKKATHPYFDDGNLPTWARSTYAADLDESERPQNILVFVVGGVTYEEARMVAELNTTTKGVRIVLGSTNIHNSKSFLADMADAGSRWPATRAGERLASRIN